MMKTSKKMWTLTCYFGHCLHNFSWLLIVARIKKYQRCF